MPMRNRICSPGDRSAFSLAMASFAYSECGLYYGCRCDAGHRRSPSREYRRDRDGQGGPGGRFKGPGSDLDHRINHGDPCLAHLRHAVLQFEPMGVLQLKNIVRPVEAFAVRLDRRDGTWTVKHHRARKWAI